MLLFVLSNTKLLVEVCPATRGYPIGNGLGIEPVIGTEVPSGLNAAKEETCASIGKPKELDIVNVIFGSSKYIDPLWKLSNKVTRDESSIRSIVCTPRYPKMLEKSMFLNLAITSRFLFVIERDVPEFVRLATYVNPKLFAVPEDERSNK